MPNSAGPSSQSGGGNPALQVQPITPQLLTNAQGQIIATVIGNQILPVINTQGITLSPIKPGQQVTHTPMHEHAHRYRGRCLVETLIITHLNCCFNNDQETTLKVLNEQHLVESVQSSVYS